MTYELKHNHPHYLDSLNNRCQFSGANAGKTIRGKNHRYHFHHTCPNAYDNEQPGWNYLLLKPWAHTLVHLLGGSLPWEMSRGAVRLQNKRAKRLLVSWLWRYPNLLQRVFHGWCRVSDFGKGVLKVVAIWGVAFVVGLVIISFFGVR